MSLTDQLDKRTLPCVEPFILQAANNKINKSVVRCVCARLSCNNKIQRLKQGESTQPFDGLAELRTLVEYFFGIQVAQLPEQHIRHFELFIRVSNLCAASIRYQSSDSCGQLGAR